MSDRLSLVVEEVDLLVAEAAWMNARGPHFVIIHAWHQPGTDCLAGEQVAAVRLVFRGRAFQLGLGTGPLILFDFMARNRWLPQSASQLAAGLNADLFSMRHGSNAPKSRKQARRFTHTTVKVYVERIREAMALVFREAGANVDPYLVLISEQGYKLKATVEWIHLVDHPLSTRRPSAR
ncbi:MAG TPA: hypothetical protein VGQ49_13465 [Bryobacteraceae bacterium]|jgi:hypothetical protein|nr:hypothetical protein [Bryobacteraceae bacterium]